MNLIGPYILIISNGVKKNASDVLNILDPDSGGANTFTVPLNASGDPLQPIDFWGAYTMLEPSTVTALTTYTTTQLKAYVDELAIIRGRTPVGSITAFPNSLQMQLGDPWGFFITLGLKVARPNSA